MIRINPTKMLVGGDQKKAKTFLGPARSQLEILKQDMSFQNLSQGVRKVWLNPDVYVECRKIFNYQECKVWVRPVITEALEEAGVYFYIHIVKPNEGSNKGEDINRLILWRHREEEKTAAGAELSKPEIEYEDYGEYIDGRKWGITTLGAVILDVDLASNTVYTESGEDEDGNPIEVDTTLTEEAQIEMAQKYMDVIYPTNPAVDAFIPAYAETGDIYSPFQSAASCYSPAIYDYVEAEPEVYFNETLDIDLGGGLTDGFYHVRTEVEDASVDPTPWCADPESEYESIDWVDIDKNADKYLPSTQTTGDAGYYECGGYCFTSLTDPAYAFYEWSRFPCNTEVSFERGEHYDGRYFIDPFHASFFVTLLGNQTSLTHIRKALPAGLGYSPADLWEDSMWPDPIASDVCGYCEGTAALGAGATIVSTPLEQSFPLKKMVWIPDDLPEVQQDFYKWAGNRRTASISYQEMQFYTLDDGEIDQWERHHPADWWSGYPDVSSVGPGPSPPNSYLRPNLALMALSNLGTGNRDFYSAIRFFKGPDIHHVPLVIYYECNHQGKIGHAFGHTPDGNQSAWFYDAWPENAESLTDIVTHPNNVGTSSGDLPVIDVFQIAIIFNLMQIESFTGTDDEGNTTYWDIHTEREFDQDDDDVEIADKRDNHNREKLLGAYVSAALQDIKQLPDMQEVDGTYKLLSDCELSILTGYVYQ